MKNDPIIKYATGHYKGKLSIVTLEKESRFMWWVRIRSNPFNYHCDLFNSFFFANRRFYKIVRTYGLDVTEFSCFDIDMKEVLSKLNPDERG